MVWKGAEAERNCGDRENDEEVQRCRLRKSNRSESHFEAENESKVTIKLEDCIIEFMPIYVIMAMNHQVVCERL